VVLASSIVTKNGKGPAPHRAACLSLLEVCRCMRADHNLHSAALVSRQFVDMTRIRIEGLLAAFPKLVGSGKQHTYVETENVRYVYQPLEVLTRRLPATLRPRASVVSGACRAQPKAHIIWSGRAVRQTWLMHEHMCTRTGCHLRSR